MYALRAVSVTRISYTSAGFNEHTHTQSSEEPGGLLCPGEVTQEISRSSSHWKCLLYPPHWEGKEKGRGMKEWHQWKKTQLLNEDGLCLCRCDSLKTRCRCHGDPHPSKQRSNVVTGSVECDICGSGTQREEFSLQNDSTKRTSEVGLRETSSRNVWNLKHCKTKISLIFVACEETEEDT